jgi:glycyl-tRNA synthetase beta chain
MSGRKDLLIEIGAEELPPKALRGLAIAFANGVEQGLKQAGLTFEKVKYYAAPRRLAVLVSQLDDKQPDQHQERRGPALTAAFDDSGMPTKALQGFARSCGVEVESLECLETDKGSWLVYRLVQPGKPTAELVSEIVEKSLAALPIPKRMRWADFKVEFVRPVHWVVLLFGQEVIDAEILGIKAGRETRGHRFHHPQSLYLAEPDAYAPLLETEGHVIADYDDRREAILGQVVEAAVKAGGEAVIDEALLDEVAALVEWPVAVCGRFDERYLAVPEACLISSMQGHQKYFPVRDKLSGKLLPYFVTVANIESRNVASVIAGNERVIRPRLEDAMFFYGRDIERPLESRNEQLKAVVFQKQLGTVYQKVERVTALASHIAKGLGLSAEDVAKAERAAVLSKCDLVSDMVGEFPELQGVMGKDYALKQGEDAVVALALDEVYMPRHAGGELPQSIIGDVLAIADKLDTLCGIFAVGLIPTGDKDPFALRRTALGVLRILIEKEHELDLHQLITVATKPFADIAQDAKGKKVALDALIDQTYSYVVDRLKAYFTDRSISPDVFEAVLAREPRQPYDFARRVYAVDAFRAMPAAESLAAANKRISNLLRQATGDVPEQIDELLLEQAEEKALHQAIVAASRTVLPLLERQNYTEALSCLAQLKETVDAFFDHVMVMVEDETLRTNRIALLKALNNLFLRVADLSRLQG